MSSGPGACPTVGTEHAGSIFSKPLSYGRIDPGSEWRLHRQWFEQSVMGDLLDEDFSLLEKNALYRCLDRHRVCSSASWFVCMT
jgi:hypothetical protein